MRAAELGLGVAHLPDFVAARSLANGSLRAILPDHVDPGRGVHALYPAGRYLAVKVRVLVDFLAQRYRGEIDWAALGQ